MFQLFRALFGDGDSPRSLLVEARDEFLQILDLSSELLQEALPHLLDKEAPENLAERARSVDKTSNRLERSIRKLLVEHLSFKNGDAPACLILMSVAKDGERLVDECRNLLELRTLLQAPAPDAYRSDLHQFAEETITALRETRATFADNDERKALDLIEQEKPFIERLQKVLDRLVDEQDLTARQAVVLYRAFHAIKRVRAHLANIASTVVLPVHRIDFAKRSFVREAREELERRGG